MRSSLCVRRFCETMLRMAPSSMSAGRSSAFPSLGAASRNFLRADQEQREGLIALGPHARPPGERLDQHQAPGVRVALESTEQPPDDAARRLLPVPRRVQRRHALEQPRSGLPVGREQAASLSANCS